jgi:hypothetical protein
MILHSVAGILLQNGIFGFPGKRRSISAYMCAIHPTLFISHFIDEGMTLTKQNREIKNGWHTD